MKHLAYRLTLCNDCLQPTLGRLGMVGNNVVFEKSCSQNPPCNGGQISRSFVSSDADYFLGSWICSSTAPSAGLSALIIEVTNNCNLRCPTCIAGSEPGAGNTRDLDLVRKMIVMAERQPRKPDILMISGGEPTIHPDIIAILRSACDSSIDHVMLITNGKRIAEEASFASELGNLRDKLEVYLQFDSLRPEVLRDIRGVDLSDVRRQALNRLAELQLPVTLVSVVKQGLNDLYCDEVIHYAIGFPNVRGVTFQPIKAAGRTESLIGTTGTIDLASVRRNIIRGEIGITADQFLPHPMNSENISIAYLRREQDSAFPVTKALFSDPVLRKTLGRCLFLLPKHDTERFKCDDLFRVTIVAFMDKYTFFQDALCYSAVGFITPHGAIIPLDSYYTQGESRLLSIAA